jgi:nitroreductase
MGDATSLLNQRYGRTEAPSPVETANPVVELLLSHRSVRGFLSTPLAPSVLPTLVAAAQSAASSSNLQPWSVVAVEDPERKARLAVLAGNQAHIEKAPLFLVWLADLSRLRRVAAARGIEAEGLSTFDLFTIGVVDATLAAQNAVVAAEALGLGTVYIGGIRRDPLQVAKELALPPEVFAVVGLSVGHPDPAKPSAIKPRLSQKTVLHREVYDASSEAAAVDSYDRDILEFFKGQGQDHPAWSLQASERVKTAQGDRAKLKDTLQTLGFGLK